MYWRKRYVSHKLIHIWTNVNNYIMDIKGKSSIEKDKRSIKDEVKYIDKGEYYTQTIIKFASNYVGERVTKRLKNHIMNRLQSEVEASTYSFLPSFRSKST